MANYIRTNVYCFIQVGESSLYYLLIVIISNFPSEEKAHAAFVEMVK